MNNLVFLLATVGLLAASAAAAWAWNAMLALDDELRLHDCVRGWPMRL